MNFFGLCSIFVNLAVCLLISVTPILSQGGTVCSDLFTLIAAGTSSHTPAPLNPKNVYGKSRARFEAIKSSIPQWRDLPIKDLADWTNSELKWKPAPRNEMVDLKEMSAAQIERIEATLRPYTGESDVRSNSGFLGKSEKLLPLLEKDDAIVKQLGLTHQDLAIPILKIRALLERFANQMLVDPYAATYRALILELINQAKPKEAKKVYDSFYDLAYLDFRFYSRKFRASILRTRGTQYSPFGDGVENSSQFIITNLENGKSLVGGFLVADLIERYGFYEGMKSGYRLDPRQILSVFDFLEPSSK
ncbi:MAG: hypothetical protein A4S09_02780 [Proteobacteria bacterium SG_bin7]|nr:MAG: hypothetical protein A4S09_02780 [Proteobacteria bacterium SG_bin7]